MGRGEIDLNEQKQTCEKEDQKSAILSKGTL